MNSWLDGIKEKMCSSTKLHSHRQYIKSFTDSALTSFKARSFTRRNSIKKLNKNLSLLVHKDVNKLSMSFGYKNSCDCKYLNFKYLANMSFKLSQGMLASQLSKLVNNKRVSINKIQSKYHQS